MHEEGANVSAWSDPKRLVTTEEAAEMLRLSPRTLEDMRLDGTGPHFSKLGKSRRAKVVYRVGDLDGWVQEGRR